MIIMATPQYHLLEASIENVKSTQFVAHESGSALRGFTRQFRIEGVEDPSDRSPRSGRFWIEGEFMEKVKPEVSRIMRDNRQTKIKMILSCQMVREYENGSVQLQDSFFHTKVIENPRATDESQGFAEMYDTVTESIRYLQHVFRTVHSRNSHNTRTTLR